MFKKLMFGWLILMLALVTTGLADEGMWLLDEIQNLSFEKMRVMGLKLTPEEIVALKDAIVQVGGGTGSFVSPDGLILTNHHVAYGAIQYQSSAAENFITNGFLATTRQQEIPCTGYNAFITRSYKDVTSIILSVVRPDMSYEDRYNAIEDKKQELVKAAETSPDIQATCQDILSGSKYYLFVLERIKDIRLVYAPPASIGEYGGDIDNWMWPRHTGDFSFLRAYVAPDGHSAEFNQANVPYKPRKYLPISLQGIQENSFVFVLGYPGNTFRYRSSYSIDLWQNVSFPHQIEMAQATLAVLNQASEQDPELQVRFANRVKGINNGLKNNQGMVEGLQKSKLLERKRKQEAEFKAFLAQNPNLEKEYGDVLPKIADVYAELQTYHMKQTLSGYLGQCQLFGMAYRINAWVTELAKPEGERERGYDPNDRPDVKKNLEDAQRNLHVPTDQSMLKMVLHHLATLPEGQRMVALAEVLDQKSGAALDAAIDAFVETLFAGTKLADVATRLKLIDLTPEALHQLNDPMIDLAVKLKKEDDELQHKYDRFVGAVYELRPKLIRGMYEWKKSGLYPDANGTLRFTYGQVQGYQPRDAVTYHWLTTLGGVIEKHTGVEPFNCPEGLIKLYQAQDFGKYALAKSTEVPVNFLANTDITGGNSGSPVMNGKGEIVGVVFDGNYEAMSTDFQFNPALSRTINVDSRYVLFITEKFSKALDVLKELNLR
ncbi:S46 family peptidase [candidate division KSB1 bacterium]|nr:S46 family peptidase [candidate division KSB1 bacterium]